MPRIRRWLVVVALLASCAAPDAIVVVSDLDNLPFAGVDAAGTPIGRDVEMMQALAKRTGRPLEWRRMPFDVLLPTIERGQADVLCATLGVTPERRQRVLFSQPYFETTIAVVVRAGDDEPQQPADLRGRRVAAGAGTTSQRAVQRQLPGAVGVFENKRELPTAQRLLERDVDAAVMDGPAAQALVRTSNGRLRCWPEPLDAERYALALPKDRTALRDQLDEALRALRASGELQQLDAAHGLRD